MIRKFGEAVPQIDRSAFIHDSAEIIGRVRIGRKSSIWPLVVLRGDIEPITLGEKVNVQDSTVIHTTRGLPVRLDTGVTIGHGAILHGCHVAPYCLIGMGAILLDGCEIGTETLIGAGAVIPERMKVPPRSLVLGIPGKVVRKLRQDEIDELHQRATDYVKYADQHRTGSRPVEISPKKSRS